MTVAASEDGSERDRELCKYAQASAAGFEGPPVTQVRFVNPALLGTATAPASCPETLRPVSSQPSWPGAAAVLSGTGSPQGPRPSHCTPRTNRLATRESGFNHRHRDSVAAWRSFLSRSH